MTMSQVEDIQLASECMGLTVTREGRARVRVNLKRDYAHRENSHGAWWGYLIFLMWFRVRERVLGKQKAVGIQGRKRVSRRR